MERAARLGKLFRQLPEGLIAEAVGRGRNTRPCRALGRGADGRHSQQHRGNTS
jgi:hypothetical protein